MNLLQIGPVTFNLVFNADGTNRETTRDYVEKPVIGVAPVLEDMGDGVERFSVGGRLVPARLGGLSSLEALRRAQRSGLPQLVVRGDGLVLGFFVINRITDGHTYLDAQGVGQLVDMTIELSKSAAPSGGSYFSSLLSLLS